MSLLILPGEQHAPRVRGGLRFWDDSLSCAHGDSGCQKFVHLSQAHGAAHLVVLLAVVCLLSTLAHRRRDVA